MNDRTDSTPQAPNEQSWAFAEDLSPLTEGVRAARDEAVLAGLQPISQGVSATLTALAKAIGARTVVEVGTHYGTSALALLGGMAPDGVLTSIDFDAENQIPARDFLTRAGYPTSRCRLIAGRPLDVLPKLRDGAYDIVFINGDKLEYVEYVASAARLLRSGGTLLIHDVLWHNSVADPAREDDETIIIREALDAVRAAECYTSTLLPVGNGLLMAVKD
ncbi:O-methyltransferase [Arachnia propionica]|uniref:Methyltransferase n=1 Tax=Arachnia propionica TaxID=1750 RepID=A0A3P1X146_9ACTN|nr:class I SAM-dependent methyltransferase [Arachnia propionica]RRD51410.1 methyltransferase [Arachnia propionica]